MTKAELITFMLDRCVAERKFFEALESINCLDDNAFFASIHHRQHLLDAVSVLRG